MKIYNLAFLLLFLYPFASSIPGSQQKQNINKAGAANLIFKSVDGGQSWQDISQGLPENWEGNNYNCFANESGLYVSAANQLFRNSPNSIGLSWESP